MGGGFVRDYQYTRLTRCLKVEAVVSFHYYEYTPGFKGIVEEHNFWELVYCDGDPIVCIAGETVLNLSQGQAVFHPPGEKHNLLSQNSGGKACIISFVCRQLNPGMFRGLVITIDESQREIIGHLFSEGGRLFEPPYNINWQPCLRLRSDMWFGTEQVFLIQLELLLIYIIRGLKEQSIKEKSQGEPDIVQYPQAKHSHLSETVIMDMVKGLLMERICQRVTMEEISILTSYSKSYIHFVFRKKTGVGVIQYFNKMKIEKAKKLISEERWTISEISFMLGFSSIHYFSKVFRNLVNISPSEYRKSIKMIALL